MFFCCFCIVLCFLFNSSSAASNIPFSGRFVCMQIFEQLHFNKLIKPDRKPLAFVRSNGPLLNSITQLFVADQQHTVSNYALNGRVAA
ncbi:hypothetical protein BpHYR1_037318 [Brachionus plicatilis]|uniref:Secreted protein n=1 Tax=Brachionus plicatilis TaxID=10195 RepID=A0A3M7P8V7_BRAPC|nr:hypothetical protein BpHYR1_037318 [Brachionus plicatilis]